MRYQLVLVTHGEAPQLDTVVEAFAEKVKTPPSSLLAVVDGPGRAPSVEPLGPWQVIQLPEQSGFCTATRTAWDAAVAEPYVFWLENDFVIDRTLYLEPVAEILDDDTGLAQMALMRNAVNVEEMTAGGLYELRRDQYDHHVHVASGPTPAGSPFAGMRLRGFEWLSHRAYFTTNPSLMRRDFMQANPWPSYQSECEGRYGIELVAHGYRFGVWGNGLPWVSHVGVRDGFGY